MAPLAIDPPKASRRLLALAAAAVLTVAPALAYSFDPADGSSQAAKPPQMPSFPKRAVEAPTLTSAGLDKLVDAFLEGSKAPPASATTDVEFVRRIYLDVTGKPPTPAETVAFVSTHEKDKRGKLIARLLDTPEYATNWARYWRDVIRYHATNQNLGRVGLDELETWLAKQLAANRPWDEVARELITATGRNDVNGAVAFTLAHEAAPVEVAGEVSRIFLGVQIQCAQCHDHPSDTWKRQQFHEFAAFFAGAKSKRAYDPALVAKAKAEAKTKAQAKAIIAAGGGPPAFEVFFQPGKPRYTMPDLKEPTKSVPVEPKFFLASNAAGVPPGLTAQKRFELAAAYVTGQDNPWFAKAYVNRVWYALMGDAFYTPVDDLGPNRTAKAPEVLEALATQWQRGGYDVKWLFRTILGSKAYQREVRSTLSASGRAPFASNCPSRLRADQILDSLAQALNLPVNGPGPGGGPGAMKKNALTKDFIGAAGKTKGMARGGGPRNAFNQLYGVDPSMPGDDVLGTIPQALMLMNGTQINRAIEARPGTVLGAILTSTPDNRAALNALYLRVLAREPTGKEVQTCGKYLDAVGNRKEAFEDILWTLVNSTEFITRR